MFGGSSGFPFCLVRNLVQCLFTSLWIVLWWWLYVVVSLIFLWGGLVVICGGLVGFMFACFMWTLMSV